METSATAQAISKLRRTVVVAVGACMVAVLFVAGALFFTVHDSTQKRQQICQSVRSALDTYTDSLAKAAADPNASQAEKDRTAAAVRLFKADYQAKLETCA